MQIVRWILLVPGAICAGILGSLTFGAFVSFLGQAAADVGSGFGGPAAFVLAAEAIAPSHRRLVSNLAVALVVILALGTVVLSTFTAIEEFARLAAHQRFLVPLAQVAGALCASNFDFPTRKSRTEPPNEPTAIGQP